MPRARATSLSEKSEAIRRTISASRGVNRENGRLPNVSSTAGSGPMLAWITAPISAGYSRSGRPERRELAFRDSSNRGVRTEGPISGSDHCVSESGSATQREVPQGRGRRRSEEQPDRLRVPGLIRHLPANLAVFLGDKPLQRAIQQINHGFTRQLEISQLLCVFLGIAPSG